MARKPYITEGNVTRVSTDLDLEPEDYQIPVHLENLNAHYGREKMKAFLKEFYFNGEYAQPELPGFDKAGNDE
jgi:hypothetical protein